MCGRLVREGILLAKIHGSDGFHQRRISVDLAAWANASDRYNIPPTAEDVIIRETADGRALVASQWGLVPRWPRDRSNAAKTFNARSETVMEKPTFRGLVARNR